MVFCCVFNGLPFVGERKRILTIYLGLCVCYLLVEQIFLGLLGLCLLAIEVVV